MWVLENPHANVVNWPSCPVRRTEVSQDNCWTDSLPLHAKLKRASSHTVLAPQTIQTIPRFNKDPLHGWGTKTFFLLDRSDPRPLWLKTLSAAS
jgi:hypothetical protein